MSKARFRARKGEGDQLRREILAAAEDLLAAEGSADAVSVRAIADRVGCTSPAIYLHWRQKDDIFTELCSARFAEFGRRVMAGLDDDAAVLVRLAAVARAYIRYATEHPEQYRVLFMGPAGAPPSGAPATSGAMAFDLVVAALQEGVDVGELRPVEPVATAAALFAAIHGAASLVVDRHDDIPVPGPQRLVESVIDLAFNGIAAGRGRIVDM